MTSCVAGQLNNRPIYECLDTQKNLESCESGQYPIWEITDTDPESVRCDALSDQVEDVPCLILVMVGT